MTGTHPATGGKTRKPWDNGGTSKAAPGGASTPNSQGLADWIGVD